MQGHVVRHVRMPHARVKPNPGPPLPTKDTKEQGPQVQVSVSAPLQARAATLGALHFTQKLRKPRQAQGSSESSSAQNYFACASKMMGNNNIEIPVIN